MFSTSKNVHAYEAGAVLQLFSATLVALTRAVVKMVASAGVSFR